MPHSTTYCAHPVAKTPLILRMKIEGTAPALAPFAAVSANTYPLTCGSGGVDYALTHSCTNWTGEISDEPFTYCDRAAGDPVATNWSIVSAGSSEEGRVSGARAVLWQTDGTSLPDFPTERSSDVKTGMSCPGTHVFQ